jgi:hypothetical protein
MKAFALESADKPARNMDIPKPEVGEAEVLVAVKAASVNGIDVYQAMGALAGMMEHAFPSVVGRDFAGTEKLLVRATAAASRPGTKCSGSSRRFRPSRAARSPSTFPVDRRWFSPGSRPA